MNDLVVSASCNTDFIFFPVHEICNIHSRNDISVPSSFEKKNFSSPHIHVCIRMGSLYSTPRIQRIQIQRIPCFQGTEKNPCFFPSSAILKYLASYKLISDRSSGSTNCKYSFIQYWQIHYRKLFNLDTLLLKFNQKVPSRLLRNA